MHPDLIRLIVVPFNNLILRKLEWHRDSGASRHLDDIRAMLRISGGMADQAAIASWVARLGLEREWQLVAGDLAAE